MKSVKPGRGPSKLNMVSSIGAAVFGVFWCVIAVAIGGGFMLPFGIVFIVISIAMAVYSHHNATAKDRYSILDIVDEDEEKDPLNEQYGRKKEEYDRDNNAGGADMNFCPYCGKQLEKGFDFCPKCGKKIIL